MTRAQIIHKPALIAIALLLVLPPRASSAEADGRSEAESFRFTRGQSVYFAAYRTTGEPDLEVTKRLAKRFAKHGKFKVTFKLSEADYVFLMINEYDLYYPRESSALDDEPEASLVEQVVIAILTDDDGPPAREYLAIATGAALSPETYEALEGFDLETLGEDAYWLELVGSTSSVSIPENRSKKLLKRFHEEVLDD